MDSNDERLKRDKELAWLKTVTHLKELTPDRWASLRANLSFRSAVQLIQQFWHLIDPNSFGNYVPNAETLHHIWNCSSWTLSTRFDHDDSDPLLSVKGVSALVSLLEKPWAPAHIHSVVDDDDAFDRFSDQKLVKVIIDSYYDPHSVVVRLWYSSCVARLRRILKNNLADQTQQWWTEMANIIQFVAQLTVKDILDDLNRHPGLQLPPSLQPNRAVLPDVAQQAALIIGELRNLFGCLIEQKIRDLKLEGDDELLLAIASNHSFVLLMANYASGIERQLDMPLGSLPRNCAVSLSRLCSRLFHEPSAQVNARVNAITATVPDIVQRISAGLDEITAPEFWASLTKNFESFKAIDSIAYTHVSDHHEAASTLQVHEHEHLQRLQALIEISAVLVQHPTMQGDFFKLVAVATSTRTPFELLNILLDIVTPEPDGSFKSASESHLLVLADHSRRANLEISQDGETLAVSWRDHLLAIFKTCVTARPDIPHAAKTRDLLDPRALAIKDHGNLFFKDQLVSPAWQCYRLASGIAVSPDLATVCFNNMAACSIERNYLASAREEVAAAMKMSPNNSRSAERMHKIEELEKLQAARANFFNIQVGRNPPARPHEFSADEDPHAHTAMWYSKALQHKDLLSLGEYDLEEALHQLTRAIPMEHIYGNTKIIRDAASWAPAHLITILRRYWSSNGPRHEEYKSTVKMREAITCRALHCIYTILAAPERDPQNADSALKAAETMVSSAGGNDGIWGEILCPIFTSGTLLEFVSAAIVCGPLVAWSNCAKESKWWTKYLNTISVAARSLADDGNHAALTELTKEKSLPSVIYSFGYGFHPTSLVGDLSRDCQDLADMGRAMLIRAVAEGILSAVVDQNYELLAVAWPIYISKTVIPRFDFMQLIIDSISVEHGEYRTNVLRASYYSIMAVSALMRAPLDLTDDATYLKCLNAYKVYLGAIFNTVLQSSEFFMSFVVPLAGLSSNPERPWEDYHEVLDWAENGFDMEEMDEERARERAVEFVVRRHQLLADSVASLLNLNRILPGFAEEHLVNVRDCDISILERLATAPNPDDPSEHPCRSCQLYGCRPFRLIRYARKAPSGPKAVQETGIVISGLKVSCSLILQRYEAFRLRTKVKDIKDCAPRSVNVPSASEMVKRVDRLIFESRILIRTGQHTAALQLLLWAIELTPKAYGQRDSILMAVAHSYLALNARKQALAFAEQALRCNPKSTDARDFKKKYLSGKDSGSSPSSSSKDVGPAAATADASSSNENVVHRLLIADPKYAAEAPAKFIAQLRACDRGEQRRVVQSFWGKLAQGPFSQFLCCVQALLTFRDIQCSYPGLAPIAPASNASTPTIVLSQEEVTLLLENGLAGAFFQHISTHTVSHRHLVADVCLALLAAIAAGHSAQPSMCSNASRNALSRALISSVSLCEYLVRALSPPASASSHGHFARVCAARILASVARRVDISSSFMPEYISKITESFAGNVTLEEIGLLPWPSAGIQDKTVFLLGHVYPRIFQRFATTKDDLEPAPSSVQDVIKKCSPYIVTKSESKAAAIVQHYVVALEMKNDQAKLDSVAKFFPAPRSVCNNAIFVNTVASNECRHMMTMSVLLRNASMSRLTSMLPAAVLPTLFSIAGHHFERIVSNDVPTPEHFWRNFFHCVGYAGIPEIKNKLLRHLTRALAAKWFVAYRVIATMQKNGSQQQLASTCLSTDVVERKDDGRFSDISPLEGLLIPFLPKYLPDELKEIDTLEHLKRGPQSRLRFDRFKLNRMWEMLWSHTLLGIGSDVRQGKMLLLPSPFMSASLALSKLPQEQLQAAFRKLKLKSVTEAAGIPCPDSTLLLPAAIRSAIKFCQFQLSSNIFDERRLRLAALLAQFVLEAAQSDESKMDLLIAQGEACVKISRFEEAESVVNAIRQIQPANAVAQTLLDTINNIRNQTKNKKKQRKKNKKKDSGAAHPIEASPAPAPDPAVEKGKEKEEQEQDEEEQSEERLCSICMERGVCMALIPCGHTYCNVCAVPLSDCPICRQPIAAKLKLFF